MDATVSTALSCIGNLACGGVVANTAVAYEATWHSQDSDILVICTKARKDARTRSVSTKARHNANKPNMRAYLL